MTVNPLAALGRLQLAQLGREYMLAAHFNSRAGYACLRINHGEAAYKPVAIDNWMASSPVYVPRMQRALGFDGDDDIATIFKGLQLECGMPHQYMDARFAVDSRDEGRFWLECCGPLLETEPRGEDAVRVMCHDIEDPTFDATAVATNPRARMRPLHRPPRRPADRTPHCEWRVFIDHDAKPLAMQALAMEMAATELARLELERFGAGETGGMEHYDGPLLEQFQLELLSQPALGLVCRELALQAQLLTLSMAHVIARDYGHDAAMAVSEFQMAGSAWAVSERLCRLLDLAGDSLVDIATVLGVHPALQPMEYFNWRLDTGAKERLILRFADSPARRETLGCGWFQGLLDGRLDGLEGLVKGVNRGGRVTRLAGDELAFEIAIDGTDTAEEEPFAVQVAKSTVLFTTNLEDHIALINE